ncbi:hypothetical protein TIFTF001_018354 [Ficus carica]|uniref:Uncharacterized protein n=1 Tax=Ficus carica TaxID=3494 RepID=A0AA88DJ75_FICCA|nr:hypothetical protein TIFTF001_018354 [Ficus carica]
MLAEFFRDDLRLRTGVLGSRLRFRRNFRHHARPGVVISAIAQGFVLGHCCRNFAVTEFTIRVTCDDTGVA